MIPLQLCTEIQHCGEILHEELDLCLFSREESSSEPQQTIHPENCFDTKTWMLRARLTMLPSASHSDLYGATGLHCPHATSASDARLRLLPAGGLCELIYFEDKC